MFLYPQNIESKLGFDKIKQQVLDRCTGELGKSIVALLSPLNDASKIQRLLAETAEQKEQLESGGAFPELRGFTLDKALKHAQIEGYQLEIEILFQLKLNLDLTLSCTRYFKKNQEAFPIWSDYSEEIDVPLLLSNRLEQVFDKQGNIKDGASDELKQLRKTINQSEVRVRKSLESILGKARSDGHTEKESALTIRDGRLVLPMHAEHKRRIKGMVVDESATGKTVYVEPLEVFNLNNSIRELQFAERREINKILLDLTTKIAPLKDEIVKCQSFLGRLDFTRAKARLAIELKANQPQLNNSKGLHLKDARHPLLQLAHQKQDLPIIPMTLELDSSTRVVVISGPNAGGKSVCLKTVGLLQLMFQSGLLIPAHEDSSLGCFKKMFVDIGDEQSIENDLSTYSSHLHNMNQFVRLADDASLFLIDEFGTGTEPQFGGPIAEAILKYLVNSDTFGVVTTHYSNLKKFAEKTPQVENAAMRFDLENLEPLYVLEIGRPGSSFALEIAAKTGLPNQVLSDAKANIGEDHVTFEKLVSQLEQAKQQHLQEIEQLNTVKATLQQQQKGYEELIAKHQEKKKALIIDAKEEAQLLISQANQKIESTIRAIKENKADKVVTKAVRKDLERFQKQVEVEKELPKKTSTVYYGPIAKGDLVQIDNSETHGEVLKVSAIWAEVRLGALKSKIKLERLKKIGHRQETDTSYRTSKGASLYQKRAHFSSELDVRGQRADAALKYVTSFLDDGIMLGMKDLRIVHGKGDGILRQLIRTYLQEEQGVDSFSDEANTRGGNGVTLVYLK